MNLFKRIFIFLTLPWTFGFVGALTGSTDVCLWFGVTGCFIGFFVLFRGHWPFQGLKIKKPKITIKTEFDFTGQEQICQACRKRFTADKNYNICDDCIDEMADQ